MVLYSFPRVRLMKLFQVLEIASLSMWRIMEDILSIFLSSKSVHTSLFALSLVETIFDNISTIKLPGLEQSNFVLFFL